ncbi:hypothetical protein C1H46_037641 [Malus baccata]|uniref:Uncharacterized protein n=1 Tax=Malus baccata TaxID=106549 RepID=A0A540KRH1_MALBA|nr:hypothetical protein C1H46_037641 [Malus baccata]
MFASYRLLPDNCSISFGSLSVNLYDQGSSSVSNDDCEVYFRHSRYGFLFINIVNISF